MVLADDESWGVAAVGEGEAAGRGIEAGKKQGGHDVSVEGPEDGVGTGHDAAQGVAFQGEGAHGVGDGERGAGAGDAVSEGVDEGDVDGAVGKGEPVVQISAAGGVVADGCVADGQFEAVDVERPGPQGVFQGTQRLAVGLAQSLVAFFQLHVQCHDAAVGFGQLVFQPVKFPGEGVGAFERRQFQCQRRRPPPPPPPHAPVLRASRAFRAGWSAAPSGRQALPAGRGGATSSGARATVPLSGRCRSTARGRPNGPARRATPSRLTGAMPARQGLQPGRRSAELSGGPMHTAVSPSRRHARTTHTA